MAYLPGRVDLIRLHSTILAALFLLIRPGAMSDLTRKQFTSVIYVLQHSPFLKSHQEKEFRRLFGHAKSHSHYWDKVLSSFSYVGNILNYIEFIPLLSRSLMRDHLKEVVSKSDTPVYKLISSGTTGIPITFFVDKKLLLRRVALIDYILERLLGISEKRILRLSFQDMPWASFHGVYMNPLSLSEDRVAALFSSYNPTVLYGTVSHVTLFAEFLKRHSLVSPFLLVLVRSEFLDNAQRVYLERIFDVNIYSVYASREFGPIAQECILRNGFHVNEDYLFLEIVDENGKSIKEGEIGKIVITSFYNRSLPFIRYDIGDRGKFVPGKCACGLETRRILLNGRNSEFIRLPNNLRVSVLDLYPAVSIPHVVRSFQFYQNSKLEIRVSIIFQENIDQGYGKETIKKRIESILSKLHSYPPEILVEAVSHIPLTRTGKQISLISSF